jgi:hypothetical protein
VAKLLWDVSASSRQNRRDFLESWRSIDRADDIALEVTGRQLMGTYLPADVLRAAIASPYPTRRLLRISELWPLLEWDADARRIKVKTPAWIEPGRCRRRAVGYLCVYFVLGAGAALVLQFVLQLPPTRAVTWMFAVALFGLVIAAFEALRRSDGLWALGKWGLTLVADTNALLAAGPAAVGTGLVLRHEPAVGDAALEAPAAQATTGARLGAAPILSFDSARRRAWAHGALRLHQEGEYVRI